MHNFMWNYVMGVDCLKYLRLRKYLSKNAFGSNVYFSHNVSRMICVEKLILLLRLAYLVSPKS